MPLNPLNNHYAMENPATVYDEEAMTALQLAGRTNGKVNEVVEAFNKLEKDTQDHMGQQDKTIQDTFVTALPEKVKAEFQKNIDNGIFEGMVDDYAGKLTERVENLFSKVKEGTTASDAELIDARVGNNGNTYGSTGTAIRSQIASFVEDYGDVNGLNLVKCGVITEGKWINAQGLHITNADSMFITCKLRNQNDLTLWMGVGGLDLFATQMGGIAFKNKDGLAIRVTDASEYKTGVHDGLPYAVIPVPANAVAVECTVKLSTTWDARSTMILTQGTFKDLENPTVSGLGGYKFITDGVGAGDLLKYCTVLGANLVQNGTIHEGAWINQEGEIKTADGTSYVDIPVTGGRDLNFCLGVTGVELTATRLGGMVFLNKSQTIIGVIAIENYQVSHVYNGCACATIPVPSGATSFRCTIKLGETWDATETMIATHDNWGNIGNSAITHIAGVPIYNHNSAPWSALTWAVVGDSLTEHNTRTTKNYHDYVAEKTGICVVNLGASGTGYKRTEDEGKAFYQRITQVPDTADVVTIFGSGNDLSLSSSLGDANDTGTDTICGCINTTIDNLLNKLPTVQLGIVSPTPWVNNTPEDNGTMARYTEKLREICQRRGIPFLDLFHCSGLRPNDATFRTLAYSKDSGNGVHPDETGHKMIASQFYRFLQELIGIF